MARDFADSRRTPGAKPRRVCAPTMAAAPAAGSALAGGDNHRLVNPGAIVGRCVPDVAANADWNASPYWLVVDGKSPRQWRDQRGEPVVGIAGNAYQSGA